MKILKKPLINNFIVNDKLSVTFEVNVFMIYLVSSLICFLQSHFEKNEEMFPINHLILLNYHLKFLIIDSLKINNFIIKVFILSHFLYFLICFAEKRSNEVTLLEFSFNKILKILENKF